MNPLKLQKIVYLIFGHYRSINGYKLVPHDLDMCTSQNRNIKILEVDKSSASTTGFYRTSLTIDPHFISSSTNKLVTLDPLPVEGLYFIARSQGFNNARIIAHILSWGENGESLFAFVAR